LVLRSRRRREERRGGCLSSSGGDSDGFGEDDVGIGGWWTRGAIDLFAKGKLSLNGSR